MIQTGGGSYCSSPYAITAMLTARTNLGYSFNQFFGEIEMEKGKK
jgi:hypothetical protein